MLQAIVLELEWISTALHQLLQLKLLAFFSPAFGSFLCVERWHAFFSFGQSLKTLDHLLIDFVDLVEVVLQDVFLPLNLVVELHLDFACTLRGLPRFARCDVMVLKDLFSQIALFPSR